MYKKKGRNSLFSRRDGNRQTRKMAGKSWSRGPFFRVCNAMLNHSYTSLFFAKGLVDQEGVFVEGKLGEYF